MTTGPLEAAPVSRPGNVRWRILALLAIAPASAYLTRIISAANTTIAREFNTTDDVMGNVIAGFALGYFIFQIPGGILASTWGVRRSLALMSLSWSLCAFLGTLAETPEQLKMARFAIGVTQAGLVPCCAQAIAHWFPHDQRGIASAMMNCGMQLGGIAATALTARLIEPLGWRGAMRAYSLTGAVWAVAFLVYYRNRPGEHRGVNSAELALMPTGTQVATAGRATWIRVARRLGTSTRLRALARRRLTRATSRLGLAFLSLTLWAYAVQAVFRAYAYEFYTTWCPAYLEKAYGASKVESASLTTLPLWTLGIGGLLAGYAVDVVMRRTGNRWLSRSGLASFGLAACGTCFALATTLSTPQAVMGLLATGALFASLGGPASWATAMDLGGRRAAILAGGMNMMGNIGAYYCPIQVGRLFKSIEGSGGDWSLVLWLFAGVNFACAAAWIFVNPRRALFD